MIDLSGRTIFLSGSSGFMGPKIIDKLCDVGAKVIDINESIVNISDPQSVDEYVSSLDKSFDALINNAGISFKGRDITDEQFVQTLMVNTFGTYRITNSLYSKIKRGGSIVNVGSVYGATVPNYSIYDSNKEQYNNISYGATKASVLQMTKIMAVQYAEKNIRVNSISPGGILGEQEPEFIRKYIQDVPLRRMVSTDEVIDCIIFLISDMSSGITGQNIIVDAGLSIK